MMLVHLAHYSSGSMLGDLSCGLSTALTRAAHFGSKLDIDAWKLVACLIWRVPCGSCTSARSLVDWASQLMGIEVMSDHPTQGPKE